MAGFLDHAAANPDKPALIFADTGAVETYGELEQRSRRIAHILRNAGLGEGDCIAILIGNSPSLFDLYWATQRIGLYLTPLNWHSTADELAYVLDNCDARMLIAEGALAELATATRAVAAGVDHFLSVDGAIEGFGPLETSLADICEDQPLENQRAGSVMIYSSGTTGRPKGIRRPLPDRSFDDPAYVDATTLVMRTFGFVANDIYLCPAPLYHAGPLRSCSAMQMLGATVVAMQRFDAAKILQVIEEQSVTVAQFVPTHFKRMLDLPLAERARWRHDRLRTVVHAAAPCPPLIKRAMIDWWGPIILEYYAGTEGGGVMIDTEAWLAKPGSVGRPWTGLDVAIRSDGDQMVKTPGLEGPIYFCNVNSAALNFSYHKDPEKTAAACHGRWFTLGDIGFLDEDGYLYLTDRQANLIVSGGVNIYPQEAEDVLAAHPKILDVAVIGVPDEEMGEAVKAVVKLSTGMMASPALAAELIAYVRASLAGYKCPRSIDFVDSLPRTDTGKLQKRLLRDRYWQGRGSRLV
ncbi:MAG: AMP-binding protein [Beijerinckiaceae bacterium]|nr:AMP-binding protein [Beijerinckiaceae bacterium]